MNRTWCQTLGISNHNSINTDAYKTYTRARARRQAAHLSLAVLRNTLAGDGIATHDEDGPVHRHAKEFVHPVAERKKKTQRCPNRPGSKPSGVDTENYVRLRARRGATQTTTCAPLPPPKKKVFAQPRCHLATAFHCQ